MLSKKKIAAIIIVVLVIASVGVIGAWYSSLVSQKPGLKTIGVYISGYFEGEKNGLNVTAFTVPKESEFTGNANLEIEFNATSVYSGTMSISSGEGKVFIPYDDFVTENGYYNVNVTFKGVTGNKSCEISGVVESITVNAVALLEETTPKIDVSVVPDKRPPLASTAYITISNTTRGEIIADNQTLIFSNNYWEGEFPYTQSGNYTVYAELINKVKAGSKYYKVTGYWEINGSKENLINLAPVPIANPPTQEVHVETGNGTAYFSAESSKDYDDDEIVEYLWVFDVDHDSSQVSDDDTNDTRTDATTSYQYTTTDLGPLIAPKTHYVTLQIKDQWNAVSTITCSVIVKY